MHSLCNRWSIVAMAIAAVLLVADVRSGAGGKQGTSKKAPAAGKPLLRVDGELTDKDSRDKSAKDCYCKTFPIELSAGATYRIDLVSKDFDPFLRLEDPTGAKVAEDNDSGGRVNARIAYKAAKSGMHKIVVSTFGANETGKFKLTATLESPAQDKAVEKVEKKEPAKQPAKEPPSKAPPGKAIALKLEAGKPLQVNGQLAKSDATDADKKHFKLYTITLTGGMEYRIDMKGGKDLDAYLRVEDEAGKIMAEDQFGDPNESGVKFTPAKTARFRIVCTSYKAGMTGNYTLKVAEQSAPKKPATPPPGKEPPKKEPPKKEPPKKEPPKKEPPKKEPPAKKTPPKEQTLQVEVGKPITIKGQITDKDKKNATGRFFKAYTFQALAGHLYRFEMTGQGDFDPQVSIQNMAGQTVRSEDHGDLGFSRLSFQPAQSGNYRLIAGAFLTGKTGSFTLTGSVLAPPEPHRKPTVAAMPAFKPVLRTEISGQLTEKDGTDKDGRAYKVFTFQANPKKMYIIAMTGIGFGAQLRLEDANGKLIKYEDDFAGNASHLHVPAGSGGTLRIIAAAPAPNQFGTFTITITERDPVPAALNTVVFERSALINGRLTGDDGIDTLGKFQKVYVINATAGKYYSCELTAKGFDAVLRLEDAKGTFLRGESAGARNNSRLEFRADAAQTYHLVIAAVLRGQFGDFVLKIAERDKPSIAGAPPQAPLQPAKQTAAPAPSSTPFKLADGKSTIDGTITAKDPRDNHGRFFKAFPFTAAKGRTYRFEIVGKGGLDPLVRIDDDAGRPIKDEDFGDGKVSRVTFHAYTAIASTFNPNQTGAFTLSASELDIKPATPVPLTLKDGKASIQGKLTAADAVLLTGNKVYQEYTFTAQAGTTYKIDLASKAFNAYLALKDAQGKTLAANDDANPSTLDARIVHTAPKTATYHILVTSLAGGFGPFVLAVGEAAGADKLASLVEALMTAPADERRQILTEVEQDFQAIAGKLTQADAELAQRAAQNLEVTDRQLAAEAYAALGKILAGSSSANIAKDGKVMLGAARRLGLIGNRLEVTGTTTDGKTFDLAKLKGKVVLVNFWASWCLECKAELPNIRKLYDKYHAQGFEVIGISADNKESELTSYLKKEELPWPSIYKEANAIADAYGVFRIPLSILVGRDGRVLSLNARGAELERLLAEQFQGKK
jgi:peroxiredoxin